MSRIYSEVIRMAPLSKEAKLAGWHTSQRKRHSIGAMVHRNFTWTFGMGWFLCAFVRALDGMVTLHAGHRADCGS